MFNIVICEMKKLKRIWIFLIIGVFVLIKGSAIPLNLDTIKSADEYYTWVNMGVFSYGFLGAINILTAYLIIMEFNNNTFVNMVTYKCERWKIFLAKIITVMIISLLLYILEFAMLSLLTFISFKETLTLGVLTKHFYITLKAFIFQMLMITVTACLALVSQNIIVPIMYIAMQLIASFLFLFYSQVRAFIPFPLPVVSNLMLIKDNYRFLKDISIMPSNVIIAVMMFILGIIYGCWYISRMEVE